VAHKPLFVPETCPALQLLEQFKRTKVHVAVVVDEYGGTHGLVTLNDVVRVLVGDLSRKGEESPPVATKRADGSWLLDGRLPLHELAATLDISWDVATEQTEARTVAGLVLDLLGHIPKVAETVGWHGWTLEVVDMDGTRIDQVLARRSAVEAGSAGDA
jgi:putative hemolysin